MDKTRGETEKSQLHMPLFDVVLERAQKSNDPKELSKLSWEYKDNPAMLNAIAFNMHAHNNTLEEIVAVHAFPRGFEDRKVLQMLQDIRYTGLETLKKKHVMRSAPKLRK
jgi:transcriptional regulator with AAA-type ATPase domain